MVIACIAFLVGCSGESAPHIPYTSKTDTICRQDFYDHIYNEILRDEILRDFYIPRQTFEESFTLLCEEGLYFDEDNHSYESLLLKKKKDALINLRILSPDFSYGTNNGKSIWFWSENRSFEDFWRSYWCDYDKLRPENKNAANFFCFSGLTSSIKTLHDSSSSPSLDEPISLEEQDCVRDFLKSRRIFEPANSIHTKDHNGNEIILCFSDSKTYIMFDNFLSDLSEKNDLINTFVYFDETGTELALWINTLSNGMFALPLNIYQGSALTLSCPAEKTFIQNKFNLLVSLLPQDVQDKAHSDYKSLISSTQVGQTFTYCSDIYSHCEYTLSYIPSDGYRSCFCLQIN